jgi:hypothetical protein
MHNEPEPRLPMKRIIVCALLALASGCAFLPTGSGDRTVAPNQEFTLDEGRIAVVAGPALAVEFVEVTEDTRCPIEALCVSAGSATVRVRVSRDGFDPAVLDLRTDDPSASTAEYGSYAVLLLGLDPAPSVSVEDPDYRATLRVYAVHTDG